MKQFVSSSTARVLGSVIAQLSLVLHWIDAREVWRSRLTKLGDGIFVYLGEDKGLAVGHKVHLVAYRQLKVLSDFHRNDDCAPLANPHANMLRSSSHV